MFFAEKVWDQWWTETIRRDYTENTVLPAKRLNSQSIVLIVVVNENKIDKAE